MGKICLFLKSYKTDRLIENKNQIPYWTLDLTLYYHHNLSNPVEHLYDLYYHDLIWRIYVNPGSIQTLLFCHFQNGLWLSWWI